VETNLIAQLLTVAVVVLAGFAALAYLLVRRMKRRVAALRSELSGSPEFADDRTYNLVRIARSEAGILRQRGVDVQAATDLLDEAEAAMRKHDSGTGIDAARRAHEMLVRLRDRANVYPVAAPPIRSMSSSPTTRDPPNAPNSPSRPPSGTSTDDGSAPAPRLAKNHAESHFQLRLLTEELGREGTGRAGDPALAEAREGAKDAQAAYDRGDYTEALRLALRGRRKLGASIETVAPPTHRIAPTPPAVVPAAESSAAGTIPCASCGRPLKGSDKFCRACGTSRTPTACPLCATPFEAGDQFCPGCGAAVR
jgi:hypothetical protein